MKCDSVEPDSMLWRGKASDSKTGGGWAANDVNRRVSNPITRKIDPFAWPHWVSWGIAQLDYGCNGEAQMNWDLGDMQPLRDTVESLERHDLTFSIIPALYKGAPIVNLPSVCFFSFYGQASVSRSRPTSLHVPWGIMSSTWPLLSSSHGERKQTRHSSPLWCRCRSGHNGCTIEQLSIQWEGSESCRHKRRTSARPRLPFRDSYFFFPATLQGLFTSGWPLLVRGLVPSLP